MNVRIEFEIRVERERERNSIWWFIPQMDAMSRAGWKAGGRSFIQVLYTHGRGPNTWAILCYFLRFNSIELNFMQRSQNFNEHLYVILMLHHKASPKVFKFSGDMHQAVSSSRQSANSAAIKARSSL